MESRFWAARVQPSHGFHEGRDPGKNIWPLVAWPEKTAEPTRYFFCDLPADYTLRRLVRVAKARHVTLVMLAHSFLTLETLRSKTLLRLCTRANASRKDVARSLEGNWRDGLLLELRQSVNSYHIAHLQMRECDRQLESFLSSLPTRTLDIPSQPKRRPSGYSSKSKEEAEN